MKGLLIKDLCLMRSRKQSLLLFFGVLVVMGNSVDTVFLVGYGAMLFGIWTLSTLSYDEFDNGMAFILTLPVTARGYVKEKFLFCAMGIAFGWLASIAVGLVIYSLRGTALSEAGNFADFVSLLAVMLALGSGMLLVELKFGIEKSRGVMMLLGGGAFAVGIVCAKLLPEEPTPFMEKLASAPNRLIAAMLVMICAAVTAVCYVISCRIVEKKQY